MHDKDLTKQAMLVVDDNAAKKQAFRNCLGCSTRHTIKINYVYNPLRGPHTENTVHQGKWVKCIIIHERAKNSSSSRTPATRWTTNCTCFGLVHQKQCHAHHRPYLKKPYRPVEACAPYTVSWVWAVECSTDTLLRSNLDLLCAWTFTSVPHWPLVHGPRIVASVPYLTAYSFWTVKRIFRWSNSSSLPFLTAQGTRSRN